MFPSEVIEQIYLCVAGHVPPDIFRRDPARVGKILAQCIASTLEREQEFRLRNEIVTTSRSLHSMGFLSGTSGNLSIRIGEDEMLITPSGKNKGDLLPEDIVKSDLEGKRISGTMEPSSEIKLHIIIYKRRKDVRAVVHAHPPFATGFSAANVPLDRPVLPEVILVLGRIPLVEYGTPSTWELPRALEPHLAGHDAFLLANHGALTIGNSLAQAAHRMETLELFAKVILIARMLGGEKLLSSEDLEKITRLARDQKTEVSTPE